MALTTQTGSAGSAIPWKYDVFLSFRGLDTRGGITDHLYNKLIWHGFSTFRDDPRLEKGTVISPELLAAIDQSRFAIVVLSKNYATSTWCLRELSKIVQCMVERGRILPVFYKVEPSDVRDQRGRFAEAFVKHEEGLREGDIEVKGWRDALTKVANLAGWASKNYMYESDLVRDIVQELSRRVGPSLTVFGSLEKLVGMDHKLEEIEILLDKEANDIRFIGIWGMGGLGKTTLAREVCAKISHQFEVYIFLSDVRKVSSTTQGLIYLQEQIISQISKEKNVQVWNVYDGITMIQRCCQHKAVLLVLDDVDQSEQLKNLAPGKEGWFGKRSRVIITTRDRHVLVEHGVENPYELKGLNKNEALELFSWKAFRKDEPEEGYADQSESFVSYAGGLPLALEVLGSFLYTRSPDAWNSALAKLQNTPNKKISGWLKVSYDGLDEKEKETFLDITCFSSKFQIKFIIELLCSSDVSTHIAIDVLVEKSLLTITSQNEIGIHDLIRDMGREIFRQESHEEPGRRSRLWLPEDILHVFTQNTGTEAVEGIMLHLDKLEDGEWNPEALSKMHKLRLLYIDNLRLSHGPEHLPNALRFLKWSWYPSESLPPCFQPDELTELSLVHSNIHHLWNEKKNLGKLKSIDLSYSINLTRTPDFTGIPNLEKLVLEGCTNLVKIHPSIALLKRLKIWNFRNCKSIKSLPNEASMEFLEIFDVSGCSKLKMIPKFVGQTKRLWKLCSGGTAVENLRSSIEHLSDILEELDLSGNVAREQPYTRPFLEANFTVSSFGLFPRMSHHPLNPLFASLEHFSLLTTLKLNDCNLYEGDIPSDIGFPSSLRELELRGNYFVSLPASIHLLLELTHIRVDNCESLRQLPDLPENEQLWVITNNCTSLQVFPDPTALCRSRILVLSCINCLSMFGQQHSSYFIYTVLKRMLEVTPRSFKCFCCVIPGSEIPEWFNNQNAGTSVTVKLPPYANNPNKWFGVAVCAVIGAQDNPSLSERGITEYLICCVWNRCDNGGFRGITVYLEQIVSDHLFFFVLPRRFWNPRKCRPVESCDEVKFVFKSVPAVGGNLHVKKCGARALHKHDMGDLISEMNQFKSSMISLHEAIDEQEGAIVKATQEVSTSGSDDSDDDYCSEDEVPVYYLFLT